MLNSSWTRCYYDIWITELPLTSSFITGGRKCFLNSNMPDLHSNAEFLRAPDGSVKVTITDTGKTLKLKIKSCKINLRNHLYFLLTKKVFSPLS